MGNSPFTSGFGNSGGGSNYAPPIGSNSISSEQYHSHSYQQQSSFSSQNVVKTAGPWTFAKEEEVIKKPEVKEVKKSKKNKEE